MIHSFWSEIISPAKPSYRPFVGFLSAFTFENPLTKIFMVSWVIGSGLGTYFDVPFDGSFTRFNQVKVPLVTKRIFDRR